MMTWLLATGLMLSVLQDPPGGKAPQEKKDLTELSLEELSNLEVTTASRKAQRLADVPAAVSVLRGDDLRRLGVRSIPDALRMVPGLDVARIDSGRWSISIRGFSDRFSNKLQVLVDGRSVYTPLFSGVFWEGMDTLIEDIDRIEVVRGPGGATWGANAVNGVINIITKKAADTQGVHVHAGGGTEERDFGGARVGAKAGDVSYRAWAKWVDRDNQFNGNDPLWQARGGFRADWKAGPDDLVTLSGEYFDGRTGTTQTSIIAIPPFALTSTQPYDVAGGNLLLHWDRRLSDTSSIASQLSYTRSDYTTPFFHETRDTVDLDFNHRFRLMEDQDFVWGLGYRVTHDRINGSFFITMTPGQRTDDVVSVFLQDEISLAGDDLKLILGVRGEYNDYTGFEFSPTARIAFRPHEGHLLWASVSRAVRTPSRSNETILANVGMIPPPVGPIPVQLVGNPNMHSEELLAYEIGYRVTPTDRLTLDVAAFLNLYDYIQTNETIQAFPPIMTNGSMGRGRSWGVEAAATWQAADIWRLSGAFTLLNMNLAAKTGSTDGGVSGQNRNDPRVQGSIRSSLDLSSTIALDGAIRYVGSLPSLGVSSYFEADVRVAWKPTSQIELSVIGQNLLHAHHFENGNTAINELATEVQRGVFAMLRLDF